MSDTEKTRSLMEKLNKLTTDQSEREGKLIDDLLSRMEITHTRVSERLAMKNKNVK